MAQMHYSKEAHLEPPPGNYFENAFDLALVYCHLQNIYKVYFYIFFKEQLSY